MSAATSAKAAVLAHRDELTDQNRSKFHRVAPGISTSVVDASDKSWAGQVTFAMVPTLTRAANLDAMPALDLLVIDEAHHAVADSYRRIIDRALQLNPLCRIYGVTATPNRGDRKGLRPIFSHVADQIRIGELIRTGHLVPPRTFVIDVGVQDQLAKVRRVGDDFDMGAVGQIMNQAPVTEAVIRHWHEKAGTRQTVMFCSTVEHATTVTAALNAAGVKAELVTGDMADGERRDDRRQSPRMGRCGDARAGLLRGADEGCDAGLTVAADQPHGPLRGAPPPFQGPVAMPLPPRNPPCRADAAD